MSSQPMTIDTAPPGSFHYRIAAFTSGGMFIDGYVLGVIAIVLPILPAAFGMTAFWQGAVASSAIFGLLIGSLLCGPLTDKFGRKKLYTLDLVLFVVLSVLQFFATSPEQLFVIRLLLGIAIGADYAVGPPYLSEFLPISLRARLMGFLATAWRLGFLTSVFVGFLLANSGPNAWKWILVSSTVPAVIVLAARIGVPESPRWLVKQGRQAEADAIVTEHIHPECTADNLKDEVGVSTSRAWRMMFSRKYRKRTLFMGGFWFCQVAPGSALSTFTPLIFISLGLSADGNLATVIVQVFNVIGGIAGLYVIDRIGRRKLLISTFWIMAVLLLSILVLPTSAAFLVTLALGLYMVAEAFGGNLQHLYPSELFPTSVRATAAGTATAISRVGSIVSTFLFPVLIAQYGLNVAILFAVALVVIGAVLSMLLAPETTGLTLAQATDPEYQAQLTEAAIDAEPSSGGTSGGTSGEGGARRREPTD